MRIFRIAGGVGVSTGTLEKLFFLCVLGDSLADFAVKSFPLRKNTPLASALGYSLRGPRSETQYLL